MGCVLAGWSHSTCIPLQDVGIPESESFSRHAHYCKEELVSEEPSGNVETIARRIQLLSGHMDSAIRCERLQILV